MLKVDTRSFTRNLTATQKAMAAATGRTVLWIGSELDPIGAQP